MRYASCTERLAWSSSPKWVRSVISRLRTARVCTERESLSFAAWSCVFARPVSHSRRLQGRRHRVEVAGELTEFALCRQLGAGVQVAITQQPRRLQEHLRRTPHVAVKRPPSSGEEAHAGR